MASFEQLRKRLPELTAGGQPILTVSLDLSPGTDGIPAARQVVKQIWRHVEEQTPVRHDALRAYQEDQEAVTSAIEEAIQAGARGYFYVGSASEDLRLELETAQPLRNGGMLARVPWLFEFVRYDYLSRRPVSLVMTTTDDMHAMRVHYGDIVERAEADHSPTGVSSTRGRTNRSQAVSAEAGGGLQGGHAWGRIEKQVLAHRARFAADEAARLADFIETDDIVLVSGADEPRAALLNHFPPALAERATLLSQIPPTESEAELADHAMELARESQFAAADALVEAVLAGEHRDRAVSGVAALRDASERGQLGQLILHEDAATHFGAAGDARMRPGAVGDDEGLNELLRSALTHAVECMFSRHDALLESHGGAIGVTRW